jgi:hypothetical protein
MKSFQGDPPEDESAEGIGMVEKILPQLNVVEIVLPTSQVLQGSPLVFIEEKLEMILVVKSK